MTRCPIPCPLQHAAACRGASWAEGVRTTCFLRTEVVWGRGGGEWVLWGRRGGGARASHGLELSVDLGDLLVVLEQLLDHAPVRERKHLSTSTSMSPQEGGETRSRPRGDREGWTAERRLSVRGFHLGVHLVHLLKRLLPDPGEVLLRRRHVFL